MEGKLFEGWLLEEADGKGLIGIFGSDCVLPVLEGLAQSMDKVPVGAVPLADVDAVVQIPFG